MEEIFDLVDQNDQVIGQAPRSQVHAQRLLHRAVHILVFNKAGDVFLQKRSMNKDQCPGMWGTSCAGHVDSGEDYEHAAKREFAEELGIQNATLDPLFKLPASRGTGYEFLWIYRCNHEGPFELNPDEIDSGQWRNPKGLTAIMDAHPKDYAPSLRTVWKAYRRHILTQEA